MSLRSPTGNRRQGAWAIVDAALSSASNFGLVIYASHQLDAAAVGDLAVCLAIAVVVMVTVRSLTGEVKLLRREPPRALAVTGRRRDRLVAANAWLLSCGCGLLIAASALIIGGSLGRALAALALVCPALCLQECIRYLAFADRQPQRAALYDALWLVTLVITLPIASTTAEGTPAVVIAWGTGALLSCLPFLIFSRTGVRGVSFVSVSGAYARAGLPMLVEFWLASGVGQLTFILLAFFVPSAELGAVKAVLAVYGPLTILYAAAYASALTEGQRLLTEPPRFIRLFVAVSGILAVATIALCVVLSVVPALGHLLFGDIWSQGRRFVVAAGLSQAAASLGAGGVVGLRATGRVRSSAFIRAALAPVMLLLPLLGAWHSGGQGFLFGSAAAGMVSAAVWWRGALQAIQREFVSAAPRPSSSFY